MNLTPEEREKINKRAARFGEKTVDDILAEENAKKEEIMAKREAEKQDRETKKAEIIAAKEAEEAKKRARAERFGMAGGDEGPTKKAKM